MMGKDYPPYLDYPKPYNPMTNGERIKAMEHKPKPSSYTNKEFTVFIREGASLNGIPCTAVGMRYKYKGEIYGIEIPFSQLTLEDNDIAEACKELALCFLDSLKALEQQERRP